MSQPSPTFQCTVIAPQGKILDCRAEAVIIPAHDGQRGILPGHLPIFFQLGLGPMIIRCPRPAPDKKAIELLLLIGGGFAMFNSNNMAVTTPEGISVHDMTEEKAEAFRQTCKTAIAAASPASDQYDRENKRLKAFETLRNRLTEV